MRSGVRSAVDGPPRSRALVGLVAGGCAVVPCLFTSRLRDIFVVPKLAGIWLVLVAALVLIAIGPLLGVGSGGRLRWNPAVDVAVATFLVLNLLAAAFSTDRHQSLYGERFQYQGLLATILYVASFLLARHVVVDLPRLRLLFGGITVGAAVVAGYAILQKVGLDPFWNGYLPDGRVFSTFGQPNALAAYLVLAIPPTWYLLRVATGAMRLLLLLAVGELVLAVLLTLSRGGLLGLLSLLIVPLCSAPRRRASAAALGGLVVLGSAGWLVGRGPASRALREVTSRGGGRGQLSLESHVATWRVAWRIALDHPLLGTGPETFPEVFPRYSHAVLAPERAAYLDAFRVESAHDVYLTVAANTGLLTLVAYLAVLAGFVVATVRAARATDQPHVRLGLLVLVAAVLGHVATDLFMTAEITATWLFWILLGSGLALLSRPDGSEPGS